MSAGFRREYRFSTPPIRNPPAGEIIAWDRAAKRQEMACAGSQVYHPKWIFTFLFREDKKWGRMVKSKNMSWLFHRLPLHRRIEGKKKRGMGEVECGLQRWDEMREREREEMMHLRRVELAGGRGDRLLPRPRRCDRSSSPTLPAALHPLRLSSPFARCTRRCSRLAQTFQIHLGRLLITNIDDKVFS